MSSEIEHSASNDPENKPLPINKRGQIRWKTLSQTDPERLMEIIEGKALSVISGDNDLSYDSLTKLGMISFAGVIKTYYPGGMRAVREKAMTLRETEQRENVEEQVFVPRDRRGNVRWSVLKKHPELFKRVVEQEVRAYLNQGHQFSLTVMNRTKGMAGLASVITKFYPGKMAALAESLDVEQSHKPQGYWSIEIIEQEAQAFLATHTKLTLTLLIRNQNGPLAAAIGEHYPDGMRGLQEKLGYRTRAKPKRYWNIDSIESAASELLANGGIITHNHLTRSGRQDLVSAVRHYYPGGLLALKAKLGVESTQKPVGYWNSETVKQEVLDYLQSGYTLTFTQLEANERDDLYSAIRAHYPGGLRQLKKDLQLSVRSKEAGYWTEEKVLEEARAFYEQAGTLTHTLLAAHGRRDLSHAISEYPGKISAVRTKLGFKGKYGYWRDTENIERESQEFLAAEGEITSALLKKRKKASLQNAIYKYYPGGLMALKAKLGIKEMSADNLVTPEEANKDLEKLLGEEYES
jgi:hypothetical protein